jgi:uncharacterized protein DUF5675
MTALPEYFLNRQYCEDDGTLGDICDANDLVICNTCELPWLDNEPDKSCIPTGRYLVVRHNSIEHPNTWEVTDVQGRTGILIHNGNTEKDSLGCIVVGDDTGVVDGLPAVLNSVDTLKKLQTVLPDSFFLTIA